MAISEDIVTEIRGINHAMIECILSQLLIHCYQSIVILYSQGPFDSCAFAPHV